MKKVRPALFLWVLAVISALVGALAGIVFEGLLDKYLIVSAYLRELGLTEGVDRVAEVFSTVIGAALAAAFVGLLAFVAHRLFLSMRK